MWEEKGLAYTFSIVLVNFFIIQHWERQRRNSRQEKWRNTTCLLVRVQLYFLYSPGPPAKNWCCPPWTGASHINHQQRQFLENSSWNFIFSGDSRLYQLEDREGRSDKRDPNPSSRKHIEKRAVITSSLFCGSECYRDMVRESKQVDMAK